MNLGSKLLIFFLLFSSLPVAGQTLCTTKLRNNLRDAPSAGARKLKTLSRYTPLKVIKKQDSWYEVKGISFHGYIHESIVSSSFKCMSLKKTKDFHCTTKKNKFKRKLDYRESFKIIKMEIACNYVQDKWGRKAWLSSLDIWPPENAKLLQINF